MLVKDLFSNSTLHALFLTLEFSSVALISSWILSLGFVFLNFRPVYAFFRFLWVLPGFGYALIILSSLRYLGIAHRYGMHSVLFAWILAGTPYLTLAMQSAIRDLDFRQKEALETLGASPIRAFYHFEFSRTLSAQAHAVLQQLWLYFTSFSLVMILSGGFPNETLEVGIYTSVRLDRVDMAGALALGLWQLVLLIPLRMLLNQIPAPTPASEWSKMGLQSKKILRVLGLGIGILILLGIYGFHQGLEIDGALPSLITSLLLSSLVATLCLAWVSFLYRVKMGLLAEVGAWISPMLLTLFWWNWFGFTFAPFFNALLVQVILFSPWMARSLYPVFERKRTLELEAAATLGCSPLRAWLQVEWPRIRGRVVFTLSLVISLSFAEVTAVLLFSQNQFEPLSVWVQNAFMRFRMEEAVLGTAGIVVISMMSMLLGREEA